MTLIKNLLNDEAGFVVSSELVLISTIAVIGLMACPPSVTVLFRNWQTFQALSETSARATPTTVSRATLPAPTGLLSRIRPTSAKLTATMDPVPLLLAFNSQLLEAAPKVQQQLPQATHNARSSINTATCLPC
jgi:hypothetical protein